ncbi:MAG: late competence development ComFB family protein [Pseudomonadota bacterium]
MFKDKFQHDDLENLMEELVFEQLDAILHSVLKKMSDSPIAIQDVAAIALNNLPPRYCSSILDKNQPRPQLLKELENYKPLVHDKVLEAIDIVEANPHH